MLKVVPIFSLFPIRCGPVRRPELSKEWTLQAYDDPAYAKPPVVLEVEDAHYQDYIGYSRYSRQTLLASELAPDVMKDFAEGHLGQGADARPAIWIPENPRKDPSGAWIVDPEEFTKYRRLQDMLFRNLVLIARSLFNSKQEREISRIMHEAARFLKISGEEWQEELSSEARVECQYCMAVNSVRAAICRNCKEVINKPLYDKLKEGGAEARNLSGDMGEVEKLTGVMHSELAAVIASDHQANQAAITAARKRG